METAVLTTGVDNQPARELYESLGFETIISSFYPMDPNEEYMMMGKKLNN